MRALGQFLGWTFIVLAGLLGSGEAVMALGTGAYDGIAAGEIWTLLAGGYDGQAGGLLSSGAAFSGSASIVDVMMSLPAWVVFGSIGLVMVLLSRRPKRKFFGKEVRLG